MKQKDEQIDLSEISGLDELLPKESIDGLLNNPKKKSKEVIGDLLPAKYQPKTKRNFILQVPEVDSFMVVNINEMPEFKKKWFGGTTLKCEGDLKVTFTSPIAPSVIQQLTERIQKHGKFEIVLKQLDSVGTVIAQQTFKKCKLTGFRISNLSYDSSDLEKVLATFKCKDVSIDF